MKHIVRKPYWNFEREEKWLNEMSAKGLALSDYSWCRYVFEERPEGEYIYRIELLENLPTHPESMAYIRFIEETGVECVATYMRWIYLRKKAADGSFDIYSDIDSKIKHYKRISTLWNTFAMIELSIGTANSALGLSHFISNNEMTINLGIGIPLFILGIMFFTIGAPIRKKLKKLKQEKMISE